MGIPCKQVSVIIMLHCALMLDAFSTIMRESSVSIVIMYWIDSIRGIEPLPRWISFFWQGLKNQVDLNLSPTKVAFGEELKIAQVFVVTNFDQTNICGFSAEEDDFAVHWEISPGHLDTQDEY